jgi:hypothetical protein
VISLCLIIACVVGFLSGGKCRRYLFLAFIKSGMSTNIMNSALSMINIVGQTVFVVWIVSLVDGSSESIQYPVSALEAFLISVIVGFV